MVYPEKLLLLGHGVNNFMVKRSKNYLLVFVSNISRFWLKSPFNIVIFSCNLAWSLFSEKVFVFLFWMLVDNA